MKLIIILTGILIIFTESTAAIHPFEATFDISRGGKVTGKQTTTLTQLSDNKWQLKDTIVGTKGMASWIGFERIETTVFIYTTKGIKAISHKMKQKAALSKREYSFELNPNDSIYTINYKDETIQYSDEGENIISSQLMPIALANAACNNEQNITLNVLKNRKIKPYQFDILKDSSLKAERIYAIKSKKSSETWLDFSNDCLPVKQSHKESDEPQIVTTLNHFKRL